ncbi:uncharacterized protein [Periplaneta americana]
MVNLTVLVVVSAATVFAVVAVIEAASTAECIRETHRCVHNTECCSGCCVEEKCVAFADSCSKGQNPCSVHSCPSGKVCYLQQVQCVQAPCPPVPACKSEDYDY